MHGWSFAIRVRQFAPFAHGGSVNSRVLSAVVTFVAGCAAAPNLGMTVPMSGTDCASITDSAIVEDAPHPLQFCPPSAMPLAGTNQSCLGPNGAPLEHCREVWVPGGAVTLLRPGAKYLSAGDEVTPYDRFGGRGCASETIAVHPGYVDAYEVSVARFRAWVRAGMPLPTFGQPYFRGRIWMWQRYTLAFASVSEELLPDREDIGQGTANPQPDICTYRDVSGPNDNLPVNCVDGAAAVAFCWWDGKHNATLPSWQFVATDGALNRLYHHTPEELESPCARGDVLRTTRCPRTSQLLEPIDAFPMGASLDPPGIYGLRGGVREWVSGHVGANCMAGGSSPVDGDNSGGGGLGPSTHDSDRAFQAMNNVSSLSGSAYNRDRRMGIRCMRWVPEPR